MTYFPIDCLVMLGCNQNIFNVESTMNKQDVDSLKKQFVINFYFEKFVEQNKNKFKDVFLSQIVSQIFSNESLLIELFQFLSLKMYLITFDEDEKLKLRELFISELN